jgi:predicted 3-demethylubiquinone-9 3-methyltransferase (glyoxalase superfamily)
MKGRPPARRGLSATFQLDGQEFYARNGGPLVSFTPAISFFQNCETQQEVDELWEKLSAGVEKSRCGWLKDKYGLSWEIIPMVLGKMLQDKDAGKAKRVMNCNAANGQNRDKPFAGGIRASKKSGRFLAG